jgi:hypothetical protein
VSSLDLMFISLLTPGGAISVGDGGHDADDTGDSKTTESVDEDGPSALLDKANQENKEVSAPKYEASTFRLKGLMNWR